MFDTQAAIQAGYTPDEILNHLTQTRGFDVQGALNSGYNKDEIINHLSNIKPVEQTNTQPSFLNKLSNVASSFLNAGGIGTGIGKGAIDTFRNIASLGQRGLEKLTGTTIGQPSNQTGAEQLIPNELTTPQGTGEKVGFGIEKGLEFLAPAGELSRGEEAINLALKGKGVIPAISRVAAKSALQGTGAAGITTLQSGGKDSALISGSIAGGLRGVIGTIGETAKAFNFPEKIYSTIFKNNYQDMMGELKDVANKELQQTNPQRFAELVKAGIIKTDSTGNAYVNETIAKQALDKGLKGSIVGMAKTVVKDAYENEYAAQQIARGAKELITLDPNYQKTLETIASSYEGVGLGKISNEANSLLDAIKNNPNGISAIDALRVRRFLDGMRLNASFNPSNNLSLGQQGLKELTDNLRHKINSIPGMKAVMKDYTFNIEALEALAKEAARRGNNQVVGLIDSVLFGGGMVTGGPGVGGAALLTRRIINNPRVNLPVAQSIERGVSGKTGIFVRNTVGKLMSQKRD